MKGYLLSKRTNLRYRQVGHAQGDVLWYVDNAGRVRTALVKGATFHHDLNKRMDMDARWRGRLERGTGRASLLPPMGAKPVQVGCEMRMRIPARLMAGLRRWGTRVFLCCIDDRLWVVDVGEKR